MENSGYYLKLKVARFLIAFLSIFLAGNFQSEAYAQLSRLTYGGLTEGGQFGKTLDIHRDYIIIAEPNFTDTILHAGRVHLFKRDANNWIHDGFVDNHNQQPFSHFGHDVSVYQDELVISSPDYGSGKVYFYHRMGSSWALQGELSIPVHLHREVPQIRFGEQIEQEGDWLAITAPGYLGGADSIIRTGAVFIFQRAETSWKFHQMLLPPDLSQSSQFGNDIEFDGQSFLVTAVKGEGGAEKSGVVYLYSLEQNTWNLDYTFINPSSRSHELFGADADIDQTTIVIGAPMHTEDPGFGPVGAVHVFQKINGTWIRTALLEPSDGKRNDLFGLTVAVEAGNIFVGSPRHDEPGKADVGKVYHYVVDHAFWDEKTSYSPFDSDLQAYMHFGGHLGLHDHHLVISSHLMNNALEDSGIAYTTDIELTTGQADDPLTVISFSVSPNPASDLLTITTPGLSENDLSITLYSLGGHAMLQYESTHPAGAFSHSFDITAFPPGCYFAQVKKGNQVSIHKWIKI